MRKRLNAVNVASLAASILFPTGFCLAQSTPSEFAEMSLEQLFEMNVEHVPEDSNLEGDNWSVAYQYKSAEFSGYLEGTADISNEEVLFRPTEEARTDRNFPVLPTVITQEAHIFTLASTLSEHWRLNISLPYIKQSTDHISIVPGYDTFVITTSGIGDLSVSSRFKLSQATKNAWWLSVGLSIPTGAIDKKGDTPRAAGDQQLPYTMQLGSGTFDLPLSLSYQNNGKHSFSASLAGTFRTGSNDRGYRLGNNYMLSGRYRYAFSPQFKAHLGLEAQQSHAIKGQDDTITVDGAFPYPASITNPDMFGGTRVSLRTGVSFSRPKSFLLSFDVSKPLYQSLNGPQPGKKWQAGLQVSKSF